MKPAILTFIGALLLAACQNNPDGKKADTKEQTSMAASAEGTQLQIDTANSKLEWHGKKVTSSHNGQIDISSGSVYVKDGMLTGGSFTMDMASIEDNSLTDAEMENKLEKHLKSPDFFDVEKYPTSTFTITEVKDAGDGKLNISGNLTMRDVTKNITFDATVTESTDAVFKAASDFNVNRQDWGVSYTGMQDDLISDEMNFKITLAAGK